MNHQDNKPDEKMTGNGIIMGAYSRDPEPPAEPKPEQTPAQLVHFNSDLEPLCGFKEAPGVRPILTILFSDITCPKCIEAFNTQEKTQSKLRHIPIAELKTRPYDELKPKSETTPQDRLDALFGKPKIPEISESTKTGIKNTKTRIGVIEQTLHTLQIVNVIMMTLFSIVLFFILISFAKEYLLVIIDARLRPETGLYSAVIFIIISFILCIYIITRTLKNYIRERNHGNL